MTTTSVCQMVFDNVDLLEVIFKFLDYPDISGVAPVNKLFHATSTRIYNDHIKTNIFIPCSEFVREMTWNLQYHLKYGNLTFAVEEIYIPSTFHMLNKYWLVFIKDLEFMERMFVLAVDMYRLSNLLGLSVESMNDMNILRERLNEYFYADYPDKYDVPMLRAMARFKHIPKWYKMKRSVLIRKLWRPEDKLFHVPSKQI